jgi:signal transduction histidine kinase
MDSFMKTNKKTSGLLQLLFKICSIVIKVIALLVGREIVQYKQTQMRTRNLARREAQRRMNEFVSIASHELKTPLTSIKGNVQLMGRRLKNNIDLNTHSAETRELINEARTLLERTDLQISRLTQLVNTLLETSRISANTMELLFEICELDRLLREVVGDTRYVPEARQVHIHVPENKNVVVMADASRIKQVIIHYLSNAHKYSAIDRPIKVHLREEGQVAHISVSDEGPGIPASEHRRIWDRFYRVPGIEVLNGSEVGLGLGLHISRTIVEQHRGQVGVQSIPGKGTTFWFTLPLLHDRLNIV